MANVNEPTMTQVEVPATYRERLAQFRISESERLGFIEELLDRLEKTTAQLARTKLDLTTEQNVRRTLQAKVIAAKGNESALMQKQAKRPFAHVLIDGDADEFMFQDQFLSRKAYGGEALADELLIRIREHLEPRFEDADSLDILVRVYMDLEGMASQLVRQDKIRNLGALRAFTTALVSRIWSFDFVDVGIAKEGGSARKIRENLPFYTSSTHLRHLFFATSPAALPTSLLSTLSVSRITLITPSSSNTALPPTLKDLPMSIVSLPTIFRNPPSQASAKALRSRGTKISGSKESGSALQLRRRDDADGGSTWLVIQPERSKSQGAAGLRGGRSGRGGSEDGKDSSLSISIGPDHTVSVDGGRRRRIAD